MSYGNKDGTAKARAEGSETSPPNWPDDQHSDSSSFFDGNWERDYDEYERKDISKTDWPFKCLGYDHGNYFFLAEGSNQIVTLTAGALNKANLMTLADLRWWYEQFPKEGKNAQGDIIVVGIKWDTAIDEIIRKSHDAGVFNPDERQRGAGVWREKEGPVIHCGDKLIYNGHEYSAFSFESYYLYEAAPKRFSLAPTGLVNHESRVLYDICTRPSWKDPNSGKILAGWIVISMICGCLKWRPHIWIMGPIGSGKSFVVNDILEQVLLGIGRFLGAGSTEAGVRQSLKNDAIPVIMDEMDGETMKDNEIIQSILTMTRRSSSGQKMTKGSSDGISQVFTLQSAFCFASVNHSIVQGADESRISILEIEPDRREDAAERFAELEVLVKETLNPEFSRRLLRRTITDLPNILANIRTFQMAVRAKFGNARSAQQLAPLLAGIYSLINGGVISPDGAGKWVEDNSSLRVYTATDADKDHDKLLDYLMTTRIKINGQMKTYETQVGKAITAALGHGHEDFTSRDAKSALDNIDIKVRNNKIWVKKSSQHIKNILKNTTWVASWNKVLAMNPDVTSLDHKCRIGTGSFHVLSINPDRFREDENGQKPLSDYEDITL